MLLSLENFAGRAPAIDDKKLADNMASIARNCRFDAGVLRPLNDVLDDGAALSQSAFLYRDRASMIWTTESSYHQAVGGLIPTDQHRRYFLTAQSYPQVKSSGTFFRLGLPRPAKPVLNVTDYGDGASILNVRSQRYVVTFVDAWGTEGPPSAPTDVVEVGKDAVIELDLSGVTISGQYNMGAGSLIRIYRTNTGNNGTLFQYVGETAYPATTFVDDLNPNELQEALITQEWDAAPDDNASLFPDGPLQSLVELPGGVLAGHTGNTVFFSEPYVPTAWPYYHAVSAPIVGLVVVQAGLLCLTTKRPVLFVGSHPSAMAPVQLEANYPCSSQRSIVDMGDFAVFASPDGLCVASGNQVNLIASEFIDKETWETVYQPETIRAFEYEGKYVAFYGDPAERKGFIFDASGGQNALTDLDGLAVDGHFYDPVEDYHYVSYRNASNQWRRGVFGRGPALAYTWRSKEFLHPDPVSYSCLRVEARGYPVRITLIADGITRQVIDVPDNRPLRLARGFKAKVWQVQIEGTESVSGVFLADSMAEIV